jgi:hypothetical protein
VPPLPCERCPRVPLLHAEPRRSVVAICLLGVQAKKAGGRGGMMRPVSRLSDQKFPSPPRCGGEGYWRCTVKNDAFPRLSQRRVCSATARSGQVQARNLDIGVTLSAANCTEILCTTAPT